MKIISFSLYGTNLKYINGMFRNLEIGNTLLPEWKSLIYCGESVSDSTKYKLSDLGAILEDTPGIEDASAMFWRFQIPKDPNLQRIIFRDADSRISAREKFAVEEWESSGETIHIMRDHVSHNSPILGGMWGLKKDGFNYLKEQIENYQPRGEYGEDQKFLSQTVYKMFLDKSMIHDSIFWREKHRRNFPMRSIDGAFVGESFAFDDKPDHISRDKLLTIENSGWKKNLAALKDYLDLLLGRFR